MSFDMSKYVDMFVEEATEIFENIEVLLLEAESNGTLDDEQMNDLFRGVHTLKGSGASVELSKFAGFAHHVENLMDELRNHKIEYHESMASFLIDCMDSLKIMLTLETQGDLDDDMNDAVIGDKLESIETFLAGGLLGDETAVVNEDEVSLSSSDADGIEGFGIFDDEPIEEKDKDHEDKAFDHFNQAISPQKENTTSQSDSIGFYDDDLEKKISRDDSEFGFFDEDIVDTEKDVVAEVKEEPKTDVSSSEFGFFDAVDEPIKQESKEETKSDVEKVEEKEAPKKEVSQSKKIEEKKSLDAKKDISKALDKKKPATKNSGNIRVNLDKIDTLMNGVGDLVITNAMLAQYASGLSDTRVQNEILEKLEHLNRHIRAMQDSIMSIRMVPMESVYSKFPKIIRDLSKELNKKVNFSHTGDSVEIDKAMIEGLTDPLMHIIRNSLDHGLESTDERVAAGKSEIGSISIDAEQSNGQMIISISDDGGGIDLARVVQKSIDNGFLDENQAKTMSDNDKAMLIFGAGLSTAAEVTNVSGRGVGMDVVKTNITKLGGVIKIDTKEGIGTTITIVLPLTLAILDGLDISIGDTTYILPLSSIVESIQPTADMIKRVGDGDEELLMIREEFVPILRLNKLFNIETSISELTKGMLIIVKSGNEKVAIFVDRFLNQQQVVVKPIDKNFKSVKGIGAATVRGDGSIGLILDVLGIIDLKKSRYLESDSEQSESV